MIKKLTIFSCNYLAPEIAQVIKNGDFPDVKLLPYPASCAQNSVNPSTLSNELSRFNPDETDICIMGNTCFSFNSFEDCKFNRQEFHLEQCFEIFLNRETVNHYISKGYYLVTNGWLRLYDQHIESWGFTDGTSQQFFGESMKGILFLNTQIDDNYLENLEKLSDYMGLPYEVLPVGLSHCTDFINSMVFNWRNKNQTQNLTNKMAVLSRQSADYATIFHQLEVLVNLTDEKSIVDVSFQLLSLLYAPKGLSYTQLINKEEEVFVFSKNDPHLYQDKSGGFKIEVVHANTLLGVFEISEVEFPQFIEEYRKTGVILSHLFGLAIANARKYEITIEQKKQLEVYSTKLLATNNSKDKFFSILAHDLRGPLGSALGWSELLIQEVDSLPKEQIHKMSSMVYESVNTAFSLLTNLLEWGRTQSGKMAFTPKLIPLSELVEEIVCLLNGLAQLKFITIKNLIPPDHVVLADRNMLTTIIRNLISNAIKYTNLNGNISISSRANNQLCQIAVSDDGVGMTDEKIEQLFQIENSISSPGTNEEKGTGLGLILCKEFVEKHGGKIWVDSQMGQGSTFYFILPY